MKRSCCWGALTFLLPKCPACIPGLMALLGAAGLQMSFGADFILAIKVLAAALIVWKFLAWLKKRANHAACTG